MGIYVLLVTFFMANISGKRKKVFQIWDPLQ